MKTWLILFGTTLLFSFWVNLCIYASDVPYIAFSSNREWNYDIYMMDIKGKESPELNKPSSTNEFDPRFRRNGQRWLIACRLEIYVMNRYKGIPRFKRYGRSPADRLTLEEGTYDILKGWQESPTLGTKETSTAAWSPDCQTSVLPDV